MTDGSLQHLLYSNVGSRFDTKGLFRPVADNAMAFFNALAEFAYDMDCAAVTACKQRSEQHEIV